jgi:hypothetical protein
MGYYTTFTLCALDPETHQPADPRGWPGGFIEAVNHGLMASYATNANGSFDARIDWPSGSVYGGDQTKWYGWERDFTVFSADFPQYVWALRGEGEEPGDQWIAYAYRGTSYTVKQEPWVPPPPDMHRLPEVIRVAVPRDPPTPAQALKEIEGLPHRSNCAYLIHASECDCPRGTAIAVLEALKVAAGSGK